MKSITEHLNEAMLVEKADKKFSTIFDMPIMLDSVVQDKLHKLGLNYFHDHDQFVVHPNGNIEWNNYKDGFELDVFVQPQRLNRMIGPNDISVIHWYSHGMDEIIDMGSSPSHYIRAILNALTVGTYVNTGKAILINDLAYSKGDFEKDKE